ncbi:MAG: MauE/DoxX family redox-associated membrane protein [Pseudobacter sp.]|uniref:MauE/DoxX family redox-associated membrane protein n=1 Tax=Pseudobacter sp. TaxID=2045420 RepID=UPI003F806A3E
MKKKIALEGIVSLLILLYLYTSLTQVLSFRFFYGNIFNQPIFQWSKPVLVYLIPGAQLLIAGCLLFERTRKPALWASLGLLSVFTTYIMLIILNALARVPCSCGGVISSFTWPQHLVFNLFFLLINAIALFLLKPTQQRPVQPQMMAY